MPYYSYSYYLEATRRNYANTVSDDELMWWTLGWCNFIRAEYGALPESKLHDGMQSNGRECPIANTLSARDARGQFVYVEDVGDCVYTDVRIHEHSSHSGELVSRFDTGGLAELTY